jgi:hypothetical protein
MATHINATKGTGQPVDLCSVHTLPPHQRSRRAQLLSRAADFERSAAFFARQRSGLDRSDPKQQAEWLELWEWEQDSRDAADECRKLAGFER